MNSIKMPLLAVLGLLITASCSMEKRIHNKGYHFDWVTKTRTVEKTKTTKDHFKHIDEGHTELVDVLSKGHPSVDSLQLFDVALVNQQTEAFNELLFAPKNFPANDFQKIKHAKPIGKEVVAVVNTLPINKRLARKLKGTASDQQLLLIVLAIFIPPLAVYLYEGNNWTSRCTMNLVLTILCFVPGLIHALIIILGGK